jgi:uncharacterized protein (TIGR03083 family)
MRLAATEYDRVADAIAGVRDDEWNRPTDCPAWDVRQLACHVVGMAEMASGVREGGRQRKLAGQNLAVHGGEFIDALTALQVSERASWTPAQVVDGARSVAPRAARGRKLTPFFIRSRQMPVAQLVGGRRESWTLGYLIDTILTRDPWMHRVDLARAIGHELHLTSDHDGQIVADVVAEWAERHGAPYRLTLTGPAGGAWTSGRGGEEITLDAIEFCRIVSGRATGTGLMSTQVPF